MPARLKQRSRSLRVPVALLVVSSVFFVSLTANGQGLPKKEFPRLGGYQIGSTPFDGYEDPAYQKEIARLDYAILGSTQTSINETAVAIRKLNPNIILAKYTKMQGVPQTFPGYNEIRRRKLDSAKGPNSTNAFDWWARDYEGNKVTNFPNNWVPNFTRYVQPDSSGDRFPEWAAKQDYEMWFHHDVWDAVFEDSVWFKPRTVKSGAAVDWSGGKERDNRKIVSEFRLGHVAYWNRVQELVPNIYVLVNSDWHRSEDPTFYGKRDLPEYDQQAHGGMLERIMDEKYLGDRRRNSWNKALTYYRRSMSYFKEPNLTMFVAQGDPKNYQFFRYTFATCLLDDGYFEYAPNKQHYGTVEWFDEFDLTGSATTSWLGLAIDQPPTTAWKSGVWRRDFQGGVALVNPLGNGKVTVTIEGGFRRIAGQQDPVVNNGQPASSITLQDGDGIVLVREGTVAVPAPPEAPQLRVVP